MKFIKGADISSWQAMKDNGAKFYDLDGKEKELPVILKNHGVNGIRLRIWNNPTTSFERGDYCNLENTILVAKQIKADGFHLMLDFHYCDTWADWKSQTIPALWRDLDFEELKSSVYGYTKEVLDALRKENATPDIVQIGNEIGRGLLWDFGDLEHVDQMAALLNQGIQAVREFDGDARHTEVVLHVEIGADVAGTERFFSGLEENGCLDYDVVGLSYYPYWAGSYENMLANMRNVREKFGKKVMLVETAFPYTDASHDDMPNVVTSELTKQSMGLDVSVENQKRVIEEIIEMTKKEPNGYGVYYWEPAWYCVDGVGAVKGVGNEWENQAMFDETGHGLASLQAFEI